MRRTRLPLGLLAFAALLAAPAYATSVTVQISGTWYAVSDAAHVLDGSVGVGTAFSVTLKYDDSVSDQDPSSTFGAYVTPIANANLSVLTGNYSFAPGSGALTAGVGIGVENNNEFGEDWIHLDAHYYSATGPFPAGVGAVSSYSSRVTASLTDSSGTALASDQLIGLNWSLGAYDASDFDLFVAIAGPSLPSNQFIEFSGTLSQVRVLPEPSGLLLASLAGTILVIARHRG